MKPTTRSLLAAGMVCALTASGLAQGPDVVCSHIGWPVAGDDIKNWGTVDGVNGYSFATFACNIGDAPLPWDGFNSNHPIVVMNLYRVHEGRFEQIGLSWAKHGSAVVATGLNCGSCPVEGQGSFELTPGCADPYNATANGDQLRTGPRSEIDIDTGFIPMPHGSQGVGGDAAFKRMQVHNDDLDPTLNPGARYFVEAQYVSEADTAAGNALNNVSYREAFVGTFVAGGWELGFGAPGTVELPAIYAWQDVVPSVTVTTVDAPGDGRMILAYDVGITKDLGTTLRYVVYNQNSSRAARAFRVPYLNDYLGKAGFNDIDYHSGETFDPTDWFFDWVSEHIAWSAVTGDPPNLLRWGTAYSFELQGSPSPVPGDVTIELDGPGEPVILTVSAIVPQPLILDCATQLLPLCADANSDGIRDDPCQWVGCDLGCVFIDIPYGDMGGPFGDCAPDGTADGSDRFHALNCFSDSDPNGTEGYPCEFDPPMALNVDTAGPFGSCSPDGVCDGNDAFAALNAFAGLTTCSCPLGGPAPLTTSRSPTQEAMLTLTPATDVLGPGDTVDVHVLLDTPLADLRGYQLHVGVTGGRTGHFELIDMSVNPVDTVSTPRRIAHDLRQGTGRADIPIRLDGVDCIQYRDHATARRIRYRRHSRSSWDLSGYLHPWPHSHHANGPFVIDLLHDNTDLTQRTFLFPTPHDGRIDITHSHPAIVTVAAQ